jgi:hypothetical protein
MLQLQGDILGALPGKARIRRARAVAVGPMACRAHLLDDGLGPGEIGLPVGACACAATAVNVPATAASSNMRFIA